MLLLSIRNFFIIHIGTMIWKTVVLFCEGSRLYFVIGVKDLPAT